MPSTYQKGAETVDTSTQSCNTIGSCLVKTITLG